LNHSATPWADGPVKGRSRVLRTIEIDPSDYYEATGLSPDGSRFAIARGGEPEIHIRLLSLSGGSDREITVEGWPNITALDWALLQAPNSARCGAISDAISAFAPAPCFKIKADETSNAILPAGGLK
jgi:hypothetical protein